MHIVHHSININIKVINLYGFLGFLFKLFHEESRALICVMHNIYICILNNYHLYKIILLNLAISIQIQ